MSIGLRYTYVETLFVQIYTNNLYEYNGNYIRIDSSE